MFLLHFSQYHGINTHLSYDHKIFKEHERLPKN